MQILLTGATGYVGARVAERLLARGHHVRGLARSDAAAGRLVAQGVEPIRGDLGDRDGLAAASAEADALVHTAFSHGGDFAAAVAEERAAIQVVAEVFAGTGKALIVTTATGVLGATGPEPVDESFPGQPSFPAAIRREVEAITLSSTARGVRGIVIRPPILVHGHGASVFVPMLVEAARRTGLAAHIGDGANCLGTVHVDDLGELYALALEAAPTTGAVYNAAAGAVTMRAVAAAIETGSGGQARAAAVPPEAAAEMWGGFPALLLGLDNVTSPVRARAELGWRPYEATPSLVEDLAQGSYAAVRAAA
jgi:nucleoside-diphosphate-sugar epimerase